MGKHEAWALESSGYAFLDSIVFKDYFTTQFTSPTTVIVWVNLAEGWMEFSMNGTKGK